MTLLATFCHPIVDTQRAFRRISKAMSEPGMTVSLPEASAWGKTSVAATAVLMTVVNRDTCLLIDEKLRDESLINYVQDYTGSQITDGADADVVLLHGKTTVDIAALFSAGQMSPGKNRTIIIDVAGLSGGLTMRLHGLDMMEPRAIAPQLPESVLQYLRKRDGHCQQRLDLIFTCGENMMALPHNVDVEVC